MTRPHQILSLLLFLGVSMIFSSCKKNTVSADTYPPTVVITFPVEGSTLTEPIKVVTVTNDNVGVTEVDFFVDSLVVAKLKSSPFNFSWNVGFWADGGSHTLYAKASDAAGNIGISQIVDVNVSTAAMAFAFPEVVSPAGDQFTR